MQAAKNLHHCRIGKFLVTKIYPKWFPLLLIMPALWIQTADSVWAHVEKVTAFVNVNLVPMTEEIIIPEQTVLVKGARITAVGPSNAIDIPDNSVVIDGSGFYLIPGLADMHIHTDTRWLNGGWPVSPFDLFLANGVTTIRDFGPKGAPTGFALRWRDEIKKGRFRGPTIYAAGPILYGPVDDAEKIVRIQKEQGFDFVKLYSFLSAADYHEAMTTAKKLNMYTAGHIPFAVGLDGILSAGMDEIAHIEELDFEFLNFDRSRSLGHQEWFRYILQVATEQMGRSADLPFNQLKLKYETKIKEIIHQLKTSKTPVCTTLTVDDIVVKKLFQTDRLVTGPTSQYLPYGFIESLRQGRNRHQIQFRDYEDFAPVHYELNQLLLRELHAGGVTLVLGTDAGGLAMGLVPGFSLHDELRIMIENGFRPYEAIRTATVNAADVINKMNAKGNFGTIEAGKRADLVLIGGNPFDDISNLQKIVGVMASGQWLDKNRLQSMLTPKIPVTAGVKHVYDQDKFHYIYFDIFIGESYSGDLPGSIDSISVTGPQGRLPIQKEDFTYLYRLRDFWIKIPGRPQIGTYTVEVISGKESGLAADIQAVVKTLPLPEINHFLPLNQASLRSANPTFSWKAAKTKEPLYYRLEINKRHGGRVYSTGHVKNMVSHTVPDGVLEKGQSYRWRVRITDGADWVSVQNRSHSGWQIFHLR
ncbi:MAG: amidohydrolase family protein [Desulfobacterales bacterium]